MNYHFDSKTGSFFMQDYETGKSWDNHIWNDKQFLCTVNQFGQSTTRLVTENAEIVFLGGNNGCYLRDDDSKDYWNIGFGPTFKAVEDYQCEHGLSFTEVSSRRGGIYASHAFTVAEDELEEMWKITVKNESNVIRHISVFAACHFNLNGFMQNRYYYAGNTGWTEFVPEVNGVFCRQKSPFMPVDMFSGYIIGSEPTNLHLGRAEHFTGTAGNLSVPRLLEMGLDLPGTDAAVRERCGMLQNKITLKPGEEKTLYYAMGFTSSSVHDLVAAKDRLMNNAVTFFDKRYERGIKEYGALRCHTPNERINNIMNFWVQKQVCYCMIGKKAVRDNAQIALGLLNFNTSLAKKNLTECLENQAFDGHALLTWSPFARESDIYSDPSAWLSIAVCEYIKESGDLDFLNEHIPFLDGEDGTVYDHLKKAAEWFMCKDNYGPHDLPRIHHADWNDALNIPDETAESVFMAALVCLTLQEIASLAQYIGAEDAYVESLLAFRKKVADATNEYAFNGDYYVRAFSKYGTVGDKSGTNGGNIYSNPQVWAILAGIVPEERLPKVLSTIDSIENKGGVPLCYPAYKEYDPSVGRMSAMPAGVYENGGIYNHACAFKVMADCKLGRSECAVSTLLKMIPDGEDNPSSVTTTEPYVFTNCYLQNDCENMVVGFSWQTGSSAWGLRDFYEGILGIERLYDGLRIHPCIPANWEKVTAVRPYRGSTLRLTYQNHNQGTTSLVVDGREIEGNIVPVFYDNKEHCITVIF